MKEIAATESTKIANMKQEIAKKTADEFEGKLQDKDNEIAAEKQKTDELKKKDDENKAEILRLQDALNKCGSETEQDKEKQKRLQSELEAAKKQSDAFKSELETQQTKNQTLQDERDKVQRELNGAKVEAATREKETKIAEENEDNVKNPTNINDKPILEEKNEEEEEADVAGYFNAMGDTQNPKGVIKAPMSPDGEVIVYLKRRWDGKFIVSTLGTGGEDGDPTNVWISNIGHAPMPAAGDKVENHSNQSAESAESAA